MICPTCGKANEDGFRFCVKCGSTLDDPSEVTYESVDMGGYHTEEEFANGHHSGFTMGTGVFCISDRPVAEDSSDFYTSDELNDSDEEFDFSMFDEPDTAGFGAPGASPLPPPKTIDNTPVDEDEDDDIPELPSFANQGMPRQEHFQQHNNIPRQPQQPAYPGYPRQMPQQPYPGAFGQQPMQQPPQGYMNQGYGQPPMGYGNQYPGNMPANPQQFGAGMPAQNYGAQQMGYPQAQIIGYDKTGAPIYGQPGQQQMMPPPQLVGYDKTGAPVFGQPGQQMMYTQPQIIGYDSTGAPVFGQPGQQVVYMQPQVIGFDQSGKPIFGQPQPGTPDSGMLGTAMPSGNNSGIPDLAPIEPVKPKKDEKAEFWDFFDDGKKDKHHDMPDADDFFGKSKHSGGGDGMGDLSTDGLDLSRLKRAEKKKRDYMGDTPLVNAADLNPNDAAKFNKFYMRATEQVNADDLQAHSTGHSQDKMGVTSEVDASRLSQNIHLRSRISMSGTDTVDASDLEVYIPEHRSAIMGEADHAVEAMPKKRNPYQSELDLIELPEYMKAKKTSREDNIEIPSLPKV